MLTCLMGMARPLPMLSTLQSAAFFSRSRSAPFRDCKRKEEACYEGPGSTGDSSPPALPCPPRLPPPGQALAGAGPGRRDREGTETRVVQWVYSYTRHHTEQHRSLSQARPLQESKDTEYRGHEEPARSPGGWGLREGRGRGEVDGGAEG